MKATVRWIRRSHSYKPLLRFVNEGLTAENWKATLQDLDACQLSNAGIDDENPSDRLPTIDGSAANLDQALKLQERVRKELVRLAGLSCDQSGPTREAQRTTALTWRKALVLPTGKVFFEDAGDALSFLTEQLGCEIIGSAGTPRGKGTVQLHLGRCACGCGTFFLWEGNWNRKQRKFLNNDHRMNYHNRRNVERKRELARRQRKEGKYQ